MKTAPVPLEQGRKSFWEPPGRGKKQKEVRKKGGGEGGEKTSDREDLPTPVHPIEYRGRQEQAERGGI